MIKDELCGFEGLLLRQDRIIVPKSLQTRVLEIAHEGHPGAVNMKTRLRGKVWFPRMSESAEEFVKRCKGCVMTSLPDAPNPLGMKTLPNRAWQAIGIDFKVNLPGKKYLFAAVDFYSRYVEYCVMTVADTRNTIRALHQMFARWGTPELIQSDNGSQFTATEFRAFLKEYGIQHNTGPPYWPQANGEREAESVIRQASANCCTRRKGLGAGTRQVHSHVP